MSDKIIQLNEDFIKHDLKNLVRNSVEETLNALLDKEADELVNTEKYERSSDRQGYRSGHYKQNLHTTAGEIELKVPKLKGGPFETAIIERYRRKESSVEDALIEMYPVFLPDVWKILPKHLYLFPLKAEPLITLSPFIRVSQSILPSTNLPCPNAISKDTIHNLL